MSALKGIVLVYLKLFLFSGILFAISMSMLFFIVLLPATRSVGLALVLGPAIGVVTGLAFGLLMALVGGTMHILVIKSKNFPVTDETLEVSHVREIATGMPYEEAFDLCRSSLQASGGYAITAEDRGTGRIDARATINWWSWGEKVSFEVRNREGGGSLIRVSSKPAVPTTIVDYGKNLANVEKVAGYIRSHAA